MTALLLDELTDEQAVFRLEPEPDELWLTLFEEHLRELGDVARLEDGRVVMRRVGSLGTSHPNGYIVRALVLHARAASVEWKRRRDAGDLELPHRPQFDYGRELDG